MLESPDTLQLRALRKLYAKAHQQLQEAGTRILHLEDRVAALEAENAQFRTPPYSYGAENDAG